MQNVENSRYHPLPKISSLARRPKDFARKHHGSVLLLLLGGGFPRALFLFLAFFRRIRGVADGAQGENGHEEDSQGGAADEDPAQGLDIGLCVAIELDADLVIDFLDLFFRRSSKAKGSLANPP